MSIQLSLADFLDIAEDAGLLDEHPELPPTKLKLVKRAALARVSNLELDLTWDEETVAEKLRLLRPTCRSECRDGQRPCPWVSCKYHLYLDVNEDTGRIRFNSYGEPWELEESCALDVADRGGCSSLKELGSYFGVGSERARQLVTEALRGAKEIATILDLGDEELDA